MNATDHTFARELATMLGVQPCTIYTAMLRARTKVRATIAPEIIEEFNQLKTTAAVELRDLAGQFCGGDTGAAAVIVSKVLDAADLHLDQFDRRLAMLPWLRVLVVNRAIDYQRQAVGR